MEKKDGCLAYILYLALVLASMVFLVLNAIDVYKSAGLVGFIPWEFYKESFESSNYLLISAICIILAYSIHFTGFGSDLNKNVTSFEVLIGFLSVVFSIVSLILYWSPAYFIFLLTYYVLVGILYLIRIILSK